MNTLARIAIAAVATGATAFGAVGVAQAQPTPLPTPSGTVSAEAAAEITWMREEERLARDLYQAFADKYGATVFVRIAAAEQHHFDTMGTLISGYGLQDPSAGLAAGTYADPALQKMWDDLSAQGSTSLADAYAVGVAVEKADVADLDEAIAITDDTVDAYMNHLRTATQQHLATFERLVSGQTTGAGPMGQGQGQMGRGAQAQNQTRTPGTCVDGQTPVGSSWRGGR